MKQLFEAAKTINGKVVCIGVKDEKLLKLLSKNKDADIFTITRIINRSLFFRNKKATLPDGKKINIRKIKKAFKKKSVDYVICDLNEIEDYFKYFISNSVVINSKMLYIYGSSNYIDPKVLGRRYERYNAEVEVIVNNDDFVIIVNNERSKTNWFKDIIYFIVDTCHNIGDFISAALIS